MHRSPTVLIADDHPPTRAGIRAALTEGGFAVCGETGDAPSTVTAALRERPDICLIDIHMPGNGINAAFQVSCDLPETAIVMLTFSAREEDLFGALRAGAVGYLLKDIEPDRLPKALRDVLAGDGILPGTLVARLIEEFRERERRKRIPLLKERGVKLTPREWQVLEALRGGMATAEIGAALEISPATVRRHVSAILQKLKVPDRKTALELLRAQ